MSFLRAINTKLCLGGKVKTSQGHLWDIRLALPTIYYDALLNYTGNRFVSTDVSYSNRSPLAGIRVLDLTRIVAGPYCTMILGDLGAEIIKVERPGTGDECRKWGPPFLNDTMESCYFMGVNRNKKSICVDFKTAAGQQIMYGLVSKCDVLIENYVPGKLAEFKLDYNDLMANFPRLIYCSLTGYGPDGPYKNRPGYDVVAASIGGLLHITGPTSGEPCKVGVAMTDLATGLYAHGAILAALLQRTSTGRGQKIDCNLLSTQVACLINIGSNYLNVGQEAKRWGTAHESLVPYESFPTSDGGYLTICAGSDKQFLNLCEKLEMKQIATDDRFLGNQLRVKNRKVLIEILRNRFQQKTMEEWLVVLEGSTFPYGPVNTMQQVFSDPQIVHTGIVQELCHSTAGKVKFVGPPVRFSEAENRARLPPPTLGQHTEQVLKETLGYTLEHILHLRATSVEVPTLRLRLRKPKPKKSVQWRQGTVDNEHMNKKKSKCCCQYHKPHEFDESSSDEDDDECDNCHGHVERKKKAQSLLEEEPTPASTSDPSTSEPDSGAP